MDKIIAKINRKYDEERKEKWREVYFPIICYILFFLGLFGALILMLKL